MYLFIIFTLLVFIDDNNGLEDHRIVGGRPALEGEFPYQVSLRRSYSNAHFCGGVVINSEHILTAAHCMFYKWGGVIPPLVVYIVAGQRNLTLFEGSIVRNVSRILVHPDYDKIKMDNDVAVMKLTTPLDLSNSLVQRINLRKNKILNGTCVVSGWGTDSFESNNVSEILMTTKIDIINKTVCQAKFENDTIFDSMICAGVEDGSKDSCSGDSGGPFVCEGLLTGVVSTGKGCASAEHPGIYSNISHLNSWIINNSKITSLRDIDSLDFSGKVKFLLKLFSDVKSKGISHTFIYLYGLIIVVHLYM